MKHQHIIPFKAAVLVLFALLALLAFTACQAKEPVNTGIPNEPTYELNADGKSYALKSFGGGDETEFRVPKSYKGLPVTRIGIYAFSGSNRLQTIILPDGITEIGYKAFADCDALTALQIPFTVTVIENSAFEGCDALTTVTFADNSQLTSLGDYAFRNCTALFAIQLPASLRTVGHRAFCDCTALTSLTFAEGSTLESIGSYAFYNNKSLQSITLPASLSRIEDYTFYACSNLAAVHLAENTQLSYIGDYAFQKCSGIVSLTLPATLNEIGLNTFAGCYKLIEIINHSPLTVVKADTTTNGGVGYYAQEIHNGQSKIKTENGYIFYTNASNASYLMGYSGSETALTLPENYNGKNYVIYSYAFYLNHALTSVKIPKAVTNIGTNAFNGCSKLTHVELTDSVVGIATGAFTNCPKLVLNEYENALYLGSAEMPYLTLIKAKDTKIQSCTIHNSAVMIAASAFQNCGELKSIIIPKNIKHMGTQAFYGCSRLESVSFGAGSQLTRIESQTFYTCYSLSNIVLPSTVTSIASGAFYDCDSLRTLEFPAGVTAVTSNLFYDCDKLESIMLHNRITSIEASAFYDCNTLTRVELTDSIVTVGTNAFYGCNKLSFNTHDNGMYLGNSENPYTVLVRAKSTDIASCSINSNTRVIAVGAFQNCTLLKSVSIPKNVKTLSAQAFYGCTALEKVSFAVGSQLSRMESNIFYGCTALTQAELPATVKSIPAGLFYGCESLSLIKLDNTTAAWNNISKGTNWDYSTPDYTVVCKDGQVKKQ